MPYFSIVDDLKVGVRPYAYILYPKISIKMHLLLSVILPIHVKKQTKCRESYPKQMWKRWTDVKHTSC